MLQTWCCVVGSLVYLLASSCPCDAHTSLQPLKTRRTLETASSAAAPSLDSTNKVWHIGGNASLVSVSLDGLQKSTTNSSSLASFSQAPSQPGAKRRLLQSCSCVACANTQSIPALATYTLTFSSANVIDLNLQSTDVRISAVNRHRSRQTVTVLIRLRCRDPLSCIHSVIRQAMMSILVQATHQPVSILAQMCKTHSIHHVQPQHRACRSLAPIWCIPVPLSMTYPPTQTTASAQTLHLRHRLALAHPPQVQADANARVVWDMVVLRLPLGQCLG